MSNSTKTLLNHIEWNRDAFRRIGEYLNSPYIDGPVRHEEAAQLCEIGEAAAGQWEVIARDYSLRELLIEDKEKK